VSQGSHASRRGFLPAGIRTASRCGVPGPRYPKARRPRVRRPRRPRGAVLAVSASPSARCVRPPCLCRSPGWSPGYGLPASLGPARPRTPHECPASSGLVPVPVSLARTGHLLAPAGIGKARPPQGLVPRPAKASPAVNFRGAPIVGTEYEPALVAAGCRAFACGVQGTPSPLPGVGWDEGPPAGELFT